MDIIQKEAKKLYRHLKGAVNIPNIISFIESKGYNVVFFNTEDGDDLIKRYGIEHKNVPSFIYTGTTRVVFVDDLIHPKDKLYCLLHEYGHLILNHVKESEIHTVSRWSTECEADAFAYFVMNYSPMKALRCAIFAFLAAFLVALITFFCTRASFSPSNSTYAPQKVSSMTDVPPTTSSNTLSQTVYVTPSGRKFHRANCRYVKSKKVTELNRNEAEKNYDPCSICNP
ncbi:MAG: ImmA/IrrE family metallo-endopeptidase [Ruminococcaceae bacterium]|nr:ImmA/IrrE family metallo-endopeptidase [Oscillospiraceae bacterium]